MRNTNRKPSSSPRLYDPQLLGKLVWGTKVHPVEPGKFVELYPLEIEGFECIVQVSATLIRIFKVTRRAEAKDSLTFITSYSYPNADVYVRNLILRIKGLV